MYLKIKKETNLYEQLMALFERKKEINKFFEDLAISVGAKGHGTNNWHFAGGSGAFTFDGEPDPKLWVKVRNNIGWYTPRACKANKELFAKIASQPAIPWNDLNKILQFKPHTVGNSYYEHPGLTILKKADVILLHYPDPHESEQVVLSDMVEITATEYSHFIKTYKTE